MNDKKKIIVGVGIVALVVALIIILIPKDSKKKKDDKKNNDDKVVIENVYELKDTTLESLDIVDIVVETRTNESVLRFVIENNSDASYPEGMISFDIYGGEKLLGQTSTFISEIPAHDNLGVEVVINDSYSNVTEVKVSK